MCQWNDSRIQELTLISYSAFHFWALNFYISALNEKIGSLYHNTCKHTWMLVKTKTSRSRYNFSVHKHYGTFDYQSEKQHTYIFNLSYSHILFIHALISLTSYTFATLLCINLHNVVKHCLFYYLSYHIFYSYKTRVDLSFYDPVKMYWLRTKSKVNLFYRTLKTHIDQYLRVYVLYRTPYWNLLDKYSV